jgi:ribosomal protein L37AE/L43A
MVSPGTGGHGVTLEELCAEHDALEAEVEHLRAEVALLRRQQVAHVCAQPQVPVQAWQNTACAAPFAGQTYTVNIPATAVSSQVYGNTLCAGAAGVPSAYIVNGY